MCLMSASSDFPPARKSSRIARVQPIWWATREYLLFVEAESLRKRNAAIRNSCGCSPCLQPLRAPKLSQALSLFIQQLLRTLPAVKQQ